jgi:hypothetical protein
MVALKLMPIFPGLESAWNAFARQGGLGTPNIGGDYYLRKSIAHKLAFFSFDPKLPSILFESNN